MSSNARLWLTVLTALAMPAGARAQTAGASDSAAEETICMPTLRLWNGTIDDIRQIQTDPVPASYRSGVQSCGGPLRAIDLIGWHDRFGTEASAAMALSFVERRDARGRDEAERDARASIAATLKAISTERGRTPLPPEDADGAVNAYFEHSEAVTTLTRLLERLDILLAPAELHLATAEAFSSSRFRDAARMRLETSDRTLAAIVPSGTDPLRHAAVAFALRKSRLARTSAMLHLRLAVLDARASGKEGDIARAEALVESAREPGYDDIFRDAFEGGRDFCDLPDYRKEKFADTCEENERDIKLFKYQEAMTALLRNRTGLAEDYLELYRRDRKDNGDWDTLWTGVDGRAVALQSAIGDAQARIGRTSDSAAGRYDRAMRLSEAVEAYLAAIRLIDPALDPVRFRNIALQALEAYAAFEQLDRNGDLKLGNRHAGSIAYLRVVLARLDDIAQARI